MKPRSEPGRYIFGVDALWGKILRSQLPSIDGSSGAGIEFVFGYRLYDGIAWDLRCGGFWSHVGPAPDINYPADNADYGFAETGIVWEVMGANKPVSPWVGLWGGLHVGVWRTYGYDVLLDSAVRSGRGCSSGCRRSASCA